MGLGKYFSVEVPILLCTFSMILQGAVSTNLYIFRTCYVNLGYKESDCEQLGNADNNITKWLEPKVQPTVNHINMVHSVISNLVPIVFGICVGTWSDKFGRKPFLVLSLGGMIASVFLHTLFVYLTSLSTWWFLISSLPSLLTGGVATPMIMAAAYIADVTTEEDRVFRNGIFDVIFGLSSVVANLVSSYLFYATSYLTIYLIASCLIVLSFVYSIFFIPESLKAERVQFSVGELTKAINVKDLVQSTLRKRKNNARKYFFLLVGINLLLGLAGGEMSVNTLFLRAKLHWTLSKLTIVDSITSFGKIIGTIIGISFLYRYLKIKEIPLCLFGILLISTSDVLKGLADNDYYIYAAFAIGIFVGLPGLMLRTIISFLLPPEEMGKIMSIMSILNSPINILSSLAYPLIYNATLHTDSGLYNFVSFGIHISAWCIVLSLIKVTFPYYKPSEKEEEPILEDDNQINGSTESLIKGSTNPSEDLCANKNLLTYVDIKEARRLSESPSLA